MSGQEDAKRAAAGQAVLLVQPGMRVGLGTGSTARHVVDLLAARYRAGELDGIVGVATSRATEEQARELGVPITTLDEVTRLDLTVDGTDEVDPDLDLIKGLGGALLWEKIVARASDRLIIVADDSKEVPRLGTRAPVPVEVAPFGWRTHLEAFRELGARPELRTRQDASPFVTDGGHFIVDLHFDGGITDARALDEAVRARAGVVETGLFLGMATTVIIAAPDDVRTRQREDT
ncbi:MAG TPA: ribose-5-phosphate isomerase RpiA [Longimicrobiales bacterium]|nr:ribose-5-phosphate isomerase RpiA [Longimicrobiales bacterium]